MTIPLALPRHTLADTLKRRIHFLHTLRIRLTRLKVTRHKLFAAWRTPLFCRRNVCRAIAVARIQRLHNYKVRDMTRAR